jgi:hypothetical protein
MATSRPSRTGTAITLLLLVLTWTLTVWFFHALTTPAMRPGTFGFDVVFVCLLELLGFGYVVYMLESGPRRTVVAALLPSVGITIAGYIVVALVVVAAHGLTLKPTAPTTGYALTLATVTVLFLILLGAILTLNVHKRADDMGQAAKKVASSELLAESERVFHDFRQQRERFAPDVFRRTEDTLKDVKEGFQFCAPFGSTVPAVAKTEGSICTELRSLGAAVASVTTLSEDRLGSVAADIDAVAAKIRELLRQRERLSTR